MPESGVYEEIFNSDSEYYAGTNTGNGRVVTEDIAWMNQEQSVSLTIPPLAGIVLKQPL